MIASLETRRGFSFDDLIGDTKGHLRGVFNGVIRAVRDDRRESRPGEACMTNPYNPLSYHLGPKSWIGRGIPTEYYDQRIAIYQHVLRLVDKVRGKFSSSLMFEFTDWVESYISESERLKKELEEARAFSSRVEAAYAKRMLPSELFMRCCRVVLQT